MHIMFAHNYFVLEINHSLKYKVYSVLLQYAIHGISYTRLFGIFRAQPVKLWQPVFCQIFYLFAILFHGDVAMQQN